MERQDNIWEDSSDAGGILSSVQRWLQEQRLPLPQSCQEIQQGLAVWFQPRHSQVQF